MAVARILTMFLCLAVLPAGAEESSPVAETAAEQITAVLFDSVAGWNAGDLERYMGAYWPSASLRFVSGGAVSYGWTTVLERYRLRYPDTEAMGQLTFSEIDVTLLGDEAALVFGRWKLERATDEPEGLFSLVLRRFPAGWRIVHDHTSSAD